MQDLRRSANHGRPFQTVGDWHGTCEGEGAVISWILLCLAGAATSTTQPEAVRRDVVVDLSDDWVPRMLTDDPTRGELGRNPYRAEFVRLANRPADSDERFLEFYGIPPGLTVVGARLTDDACHLCHAAVPPMPARSTPGKMRDVLLDVAVQR